MPRHRWTAAELQILRDRYPHERTVDIARDLGTTLPCTYAQANKLGLHKSEAFHASDGSGRIFKGGTLGLLTQFKPGQVSANKGIRRPGYAPGRMAETQFKKGRLPHEAANYRPIGSHRISGDGYLERKVTDDPKLYPTRRWRPVHRLVWEQTHGPIPDSHVVCWLPGRFTLAIEEITVDRLELVSRSELARRNRMWTVYPKEVASAVHLLGQVTRRIRNREKANATSAG